MSFSFGFGGIKKETTPAATSASTNFFLTPKTTATSNTTGFSFGTSAVTPTTTTASTGWAFGGLVAKTTAPTTGFGLFSTPQVTSTAASTALNVQTPQSAAIVQASEEDVFLQALSIPRIYGDERDSIITRWNQIQTLYGSGVLICGPNSQVSISENVKFAAFKGFTYSANPAMMKSEDMVSLILNMKVEDLCQRKQNVMDMLFKLFGSNPNVSIGVSGMKPIATMKSEFIFHVDEKLSPGMQGTPFGQLQRRVPSVDVVAFIEKEITNAAAPKPLGFGSLSTSTVAPDWKSEFEKIGFQEVFAYQAWSEKDTEAYLNSPKPGISDELWNQAKRENPEAARLIPCPLIGYKGLQERLQTQLIEKMIQKQQLQKANQEINEINSSCDALRCRSLQLKKCLLDSSHRLLKVMLEMEAKRLHGTLLTVEQEQAGMKASELFNKLSAPNVGLRDRINSVEHALSRQALCERTGEGLPKETILELKEATFRIGKAISMLFETTRDIRSSTTNKNKKNEVETPANVRGSLRYSLRE